MATWHLLPQHRSGNSPHGAQGIYRSYWQWLDQLRASAHGVCTFSCLSRVTWAGCMPK